MCDLSAVLIEGVGLGSWLLPGRCAGPPDLVPAGLRPVGEGGEAIEHHIYIFYILFIIYHDIIRLLLDFHATI